MNDLAELLVCWPQPKNLKIASMQVRTFASSLLCYLGALRGAMHQTFCSLCLSFLLSRDVYALYSLLRTTRPSASFLAPEVLAKVWAHIITGMPRRVGRSFRQYPIPRYPAPGRDWDRDDYIRAHQAALSREFNRLAMADTDDGQIARRPEQPGYTKKDFKRAAEDLHSCLQEALEFFPKFDAEFTHETKEIKKYGDEQLLNIIWEKKVARFENGPRATTSKSARNSRNSQGFGNNANNNGEDSSNGATSAPGIKVSQHRIKVAVQAMLECQYPDPTEDDTGLQIHIEEVRDFEGRMWKTAFRLYNSLSSIAYNLQAFRRVIRDMTTMLQDLNLYPLNLWKADDGLEPEYNQ